MKRCTFVYKLDIYFNRRIRNWSVKLAQPKLNTEEIKFFWSWTLWCILAWKLACYHYSFCAVLNLLFIHFCDFYNIYFYVLVIIKRKGLLHYTLLTWETGMLALHSTPLWPGPLIRKAFKNKLYQLFYYLKNSVVQVKRTCRFCVICISYIDGKPIVKLQHRLHC